MNGRAALLGLLAISTCAAKGGKKEIDELPPWIEHPEGVKLSVLEDLIERKDWSTALELASAIRRDGVDDPLLDFYQGIAERETGLSADAERLLVAAQKKMPRDPRPPAELCILYADAQQVEKAISQCRRSTSIADSDPAVWNNLGFLLLTIGDAPGAVDALQHAMDLDGAVERYRNNLAFAYVADNQPDDALNLFRSTMPDVDARYNMAIAYERAGNVPLALDWHRKALEVDPQFEASRDAITRLETPPAPAPATPENQSSEESSP